MQGIVRQFFNHIQYEKRLSENTLKAYENDLNQFSLYIKTTYEFEDILKVNFQMVRSWIVSLIELKDTSSTINRKISCLKSFYKFALRSELILINPTAKLIRPKIPQRLPKEISLNKMVDLKDFLVIQSTDLSFNAYRDYAMFMTFYTCGIRRNELQELTWDKFDFIQKQVLVYGKGKKERLVPIHQSLIEILKTYKKIVEDAKFEPTNFVFLNDNGTKLYPNFIYRTIKKYLQMVSTQNGIGPHTLRHSFATHLLNNGAELNAIKEMLGHSSLAATQVYTHNSIEKLKNIHKLSHPKS